VLDVSEKAASHPAGQAAITTITGWDDEVYRRIAGYRTPILDRTLRPLTKAANNSVLWFTIAAATAALGGVRGRRAALAGVTAIGIASGTVNQVFKRLAPRGRPDREGAAVPQQRHVPMPESTSFPSGHSASAFAFATAASSELPALAPLLFPLAAAVAYSRTYVGVHHPSDVVVGSAFGVFAGGLGRYAADRVSDRVAKIGAGRPDCGATGSAD